MATYEPPKQKLNFDEYLVICPNCNTDIIMKVDVRDTRINAMADSIERCPNCDEPL